MKIRRMVWVLAGCLSLGCVAIWPQSAHAQHSVARQWNDLLLSAIRIDTPRPTVHARNLYHVSAAMYDAWAAYDTTSTGVFWTQKAMAADTAAARDEAISYAAYGVLKARFANSPGASTSLPAFEARMQTLGFDPSFTDTVGDSPAALGNRIAQTILQSGLADGSNEQNNYADTTGYVPLNSPLDTSQVGVSMIEPNHWQPLIVGGKTQSFLTPQWGEVVGFGMPPAGPDGFRMDAGLPPQFGGATHADFVDAAVELIRYSSWLDPASGQMIDISPGADGNNPLGTNNGSGHAVNPATGQPYASNLVRLGDYGRVLAEFWADGPQSETPPGHWNVILNDVSDHPQLVKQIGGTGPIVDDLQWDVKSYLALNGAVHNAAIVAWDNKEAYDYVRPISLIRYMGSLGQSSDPNASNYDSGGLPIVPDLIEPITSETTMPGGRHEHLAGMEGKIAIRAWQGAPADPNGTGGVGWILAEEWLPYQAANFVTPAFPAFTSGHSTFSRAAAEVLAAMTGDPFFPGGLGEYHFDASTYLKFEGGPSQEIMLQWATYFDASDEAGLSRLYGGIHVAADDFRGRVTGAALGQAAYQTASHYFLGVPEPSALSLALSAMLLGSGMLRRRRTAEKETRSVSEGGAMSG